MTNPAVRYVVLSVIDHFSPRGDLAIAQKLQSIVDEAHAKQDREMMVANAPFKTIIHRMRARVP